MTGSLMTLRYRGPRSDNSNACMSLRWAAGLSHWPHPGGFADLCLGLAGLKGGPRTLQSRGCNASMWQQQYMQVFARGIAARAELWACQIGCTKVTDHLPASLFSSSLQVPTQIDTAADERPQCKGLTIAINPQGEQTSTQATTPESSALCRSSSGAGRWRSWTRCAPS